MHSLPGHSRRPWLPGIFIALVILLSGCAMQPLQTHALLQSAPADLPRRQELSATPFFPQELYQCGPAALAMSLVASGVAVTPDALVSQVYVPERKGSLQAEMIAAGRRNGNLSMTLPARLDALLTEVAAGNPVIILQNLSLPVAPLWHYAVLIGYDLDREEVMLRSGTTKRMVMPLTTFERTWARSGRWAMVTLEPGHLPATAKQEDVIAALVALEKAAGPERARRAYQAALQRWPDNLVLQLGFGNSAYAAGDLAGAAEVLRRATISHPGSAPAFNNLATVLADLGDYAGARNAAERAVRIGGEWVDTARATLDEIDRRTPLVGR